MLDEVIEEVKLNIARFLMKWIAFKFMF
jgi:hypothetical protein